MREYWLIDARSRRLTVFVLDAEGRFDDGTVFGAGDTYGCRSLRGLEVRVGSLFP